MDDLNLIGKEERDLQNQLQVAGIFSDEIHMEFGFKILQKLYKRKEYEFTHITEYLISTEKIQALQQGKPFKKPRD
jgi:hypothetical protein